MGKRIIGLDIDEGSIVATELILGQRKKISLGGYKIFSALTQIAQDPAFKNIEAVINLPTQAVLFRTFNLSPSFSKSKNKTKDLIAFLLRQNLPFKLEECFWGTFILNNSLNLIAVKKEVMQRYIADVEQPGLRCAGVIPSFIGLYNVFIYNYPQMDRWAVLNIKHSACDLLIYEDKHLWLYPVSLGKAYLEEGPQALEKFALEVQQIFNAHYLQNPSATQKRTAYLGLCGQVNSLSEVISYLRKAMADFEIAVLESLKRIDPSTQLRVNGERPSTTLKDALSERSESNGRSRTIDSAGGASVANPESLALSLGLELGYLNAAPCLNINLIREKLRTELISRWRSLIKKASFALNIFILVFLVSLDIGLFYNFRAKSAVAKNIQFLNSSVLPQIKLLKDERQNLEKLHAYLKKRLRHHELYLEALAQISTGKPKDVKIQEVEAAAKEAKLLVNLSGSAPAYEDVNVFLVNLKKNEEIKEAKIFSSSFPSADTKAIAFKLHFEQE